MKSGFTQLFPSTIGVRQGDTLSPDQFKIFINDLPDIFDTSCDEIDIGMLHFNCLLYADDVILLSTTEAGLQNCISKLEKYCDDWCIEVNLVKSKVMIFNKKVQVGKDQEKAQSEKDSHSKNRGGKKPN